MTRNIRMIAIYEHLKIGIGMFMTLFLGTIAWTEIELPAKIICTILGGIAAITTTIYTLTKIFPNKRKK